MAEPLPIEFANTLFAVRGRPQDGLTTTAELADWLTRNGLTGVGPGHGPGVGAGAGARPGSRASTSTSTDDPAIGAPAIGSRRSSLERRSSAPEGEPATDEPAIEVTANDLLRARELRDAVRAIAHAVAQGVDPLHVDVNTVNTIARSTPRWRELHWSPQPHATVHTDATPVATALSTVADEAIALFTGAARDDLRACPGPGCVLHFVRDSPRREWCSPGCGNRARAARHYARSRDRDHL